MECRQVHECAACWRLAVLLPLVSCSLARLLPDRASVYLLTYFTYFTLLACLPGSAGSHTQPLCLYIADFPACVPAALLIHRLQP